MSKNKAILCILSLFLLLTTGCIFKQTIIEDTKINTTPITAQQPELTEEEKKIEAVKELFAGKYDKDKSEIILELSIYTQDHIRGMIQFKEEQGGGMFLAVNTNDNWELVFDGNGAIPCEEIEKYNFPIGMVNECQIKK